MFPQYQLSPCHKQVGATDCGVFAIVHSIDVLFGNNPSEIVHEQSKLRQHLVDCFEKGILTTFPKYKCNVKYNDTTTRRSISSEDQYKSLIPRLSACLKKQLVNTNPTEMKNKFSSLINNSPTTVNAIRNLNDSKKPSRTTKHFHDSVIFNISGKQLSPSEKSVLEKGFEFLP